MQKRLIIVLLCFIGHLIHAMDNDYYLLGTVGIEPNRGFGGIEVQSPRVSLLIHYKQYVITHYESLQEVTEPLVSGELAWKQPLFKKVSEIYHYKCI